MGGARAPPSSRFGDGRSQPGRLRDVRSRRCPPGGSSDRLTSARHESRCYAPLAGSSSCRFSRDGRASRVRCGRCRRGATVGAARVRRSAQPPSHRRTPRAPSAAASATHASDGSAARAAPRPPHQTHQPPGQGLRQERDSHAAREHRTEPRRRRKTNPRSPAPALTATRSLGRRRDCRANHVPCPLVSAARTRKEKGRQATSANVAIARSLGLGLWVHFAPVGGITALG